MDLIPELTKQLDQVAIAMKGVGDTDKTRLVHDAIERVAAAHAAALSIGYGPHHKVACEGRRTLYVHRAGSKSRTTLGQFMFDQCWAIAHCTGDGDDSDVFADTQEPKNGYWIRCELAVESEWVRSDSKRDHRYNDFLKLVVGKARFKLFIFNCREHEMEDIVLASGRIY